MPAILLNPATLPPPRAHFTPSSEPLRDLAHEMRQPLSAIEAIAYYLEMTLPAGQFEARQHLIRLQGLVAETNRILTAAVGATPAANRTMPRDPAGPEY